MKYLLHIIALGLASVLCACGEFFTFEDVEPAGNMTMRVAQDTAYIMVGDTMALNVYFDPPQNKLPIFWDMDRLRNDSSAIIINDTITAIKPGQVDVLAYGVSGTLCDTCHVVVFDRWLSYQFETSQPSDMVIYANITVDGNSWDSTTQTIAAFARGSVIGYAEEKEAFGIKYSLLRLWALADHNIGTVSFFCYDRAKHMLYQAEQKPEFDATTALGTLSDLYQINF